jgi:hypothetical protein
VTVDLKRRLPSEKAEPFRPDRADQLDVLARKAARWAQDHAARVADADPADGRAANPYWISADPGDQPVGMEEWNLSANRRPRMRAPDMPRKFRAAAAQPPRLSDDGRLPAERRSRQSVCRASFTGSSPEPLARRDAHA